MTLAGWRGPSVPSHCFEASGLRQWTRVSSHVTILLLNLLYMGLLISWRHISTLRWDCWGVNSWGTDRWVLYDFPSVLICWCMVYFDAPSSSDSLRILFYGFSSKTLCIFSISYNFVLPELGTSIVFYFPVLKRWNHRCATRTLTTHSPSSSHILRAATAAL